MGLGSLRVLPREKKLRYNKPIMPTYVYETIVDEGQQPERFEVRQKMSDPVLTVHPETGVAVRKVLTPVGISTGGAGSSAEPSTAAPSVGGGCRPHCGCH
jgi:predicted nucleic acid-binding Zn ribbon protein